MIFKLSYSQCRDGNVIKLTKADCERLRDKFLKMDAYEAEKKKSDKKSNESKTPKTPRKKPKTPKKKVELRYVVYIYINTYFSLHLE